MILRDLRLENFGIFYGSQQLALQQGLYVVHGLNGRGKTTLLNAVRWALYGKYRDRQSRLVPPDVTLNRQARREGTKEFRVDLHIRDENDDYVLKRTQIVSPAGSPPSELYMERNSVPLSASESIRTISQLLSDKVAQFFLFDGEQLQEYERLLFRDDPSTVIKVNIEQILGLPILENALKDLETVRDDLGKRLASQARQTLQMEKVGARAEQARSDLESNQADIKRLLDLETEQNRIVQECDDALQKYESSLEQLKGIEASEAQVSVLEAQRRSLQTRRAEDLQHTWRDVLAAAVAPRLQALQDSLRSAEQDRTIRAVRVQLEQSLELGSCVTCGRSLDAEYVAHICDQLASLPCAEPVGSMPNSDAVVQLGLLSRLVDTGHTEAAIKLDKEIADVHSQVVAHQQEIKRLRDALQNLPESEIKRAQLSRDEAHQTLGRLASALEEARRSQKDIEDKLHRAEDELRRAAAGDHQQPALNTAMDLTDSLRRVFEAAQTRFRDELRLAVEASASEVFKQLTNEQAYERLQINENYGLQILDSRGEAVIGRSAGQEQVVALSLISALNKNARRRGPVMMDTPFGRLDPVHRANILRFLPQMADQVFLLAHGGEVTGADLRVIGSNITAQYELSRDDTERTVIIERSLP